MTGLGPYAAFETHAVDGVPHPPWRALTAVEVPDRVHAVRAALAESSGGLPVPVRVAASIGHLGLVARLVAPVLTVAAASGRGLLLPAGSAWWQPVLGGPFPLSLAPGDAGAERAVQVLLDGLVADLTAAAAQLGVSQKVLWGNVASAVNGAAGQVAARRPDLWDSAAGAASLFLGHPALAGTSAGDPLLDFRRRSCCLIYRLVPPGRARLCADCVLG